MSKGTQGQQGGREGDWVGFSISCAVAQVRVGQRQDLLIYTPADSVCVWLFSS